jgi:hypothetical protein
MLISGLLHGSPALEKWTPSYFAERWGDLLVPVEHGDVRIGKAEKQLVRMADYVAGLLGPGGSRPGRPYLAQLALNMLPAELADDVRFPHSLQQRFSAAPCFWMGAPGTGTPLHYDNAHNYLLQFYGTKSVLLFPPADRGCLYAYPRWSRLRYYSRLPFEKDAETSSWSAFPDLIHSAPSACLLTPGDVLYIPRGYWHLVRTESTSINLNVFWKTRVMYLRQALARPVLTRVGVRESSWVCDTKRNSVAS